VWVVVSVLTRHVLGRLTEDEPPIAMASCFGNTVMLGIPLGLIVLGQEAATPAAILVAIETPLLWVIASLHAEWTVRGREGVSLKVLRRVGSELARNPIVLSIALGALWRLTGFAMPAPVDRL
jgi:malonate transporter and related proteins